MPEEKGAYREVNFDGLVGATHNHNVVSYGNRAAMENRGATTNPREAFLQGLEKAKLLADMGLEQAVLPPQERPNISMLRTLGFSGSDEQILEQVATNDPGLLGQVSSASAMWTANAATVAPSPDTTDGRLHITTASLGQKFHRSLEAQTTERVLREVFRTLASHERGNQAVIHQALPNHPELGDEGAANHMRFAPEHGAPGVHLFAYGQDPRNAESPKPSNFPARQTLRGSEAVARLNRIPSDKRVFAQKNPVAIDAGVFHNDVISTNNGMVWLVHELAYVDTARVIDDVSLKTGGEVMAIVAKEKDLSLDDAVKSYVFNSQVITLPNGTMRIIAPSEARDNPRAKAYLEGVLSDGKNPIDSIEYVDVRGSMQNGGGPACLRLRIVLSEKEQGLLNGRIFLDDALYNDLKVWGERHYRDRLSADDLRDPSLLKEVREGLDSLTKILQLGKIYDFQG